MRGDHRSLSASVAEAVAEAARVAALNDEYKVTNEDVLAAVDEGRRGR